MPIRSLENLRVSGPSHAAWSAQETAGTHTAACAPTSVSG